MGRGGNPLDAHQVADDQLEFLPVRRRISPDEFDRLAKTIVFTPPLFLGEIPCLVLHSSPNLFPIFY